jgi:UDP-N-acetyl-D-mannosaminuronic acid dehydrogenase
VTEPFTVSLMGLAFKGQPDTDDLRGSTALAMIDTFRERRPRHHAAGPRLTSSSDDANPRSSASSPSTRQGAFAGADAVLIMNNNRRYYWMDVEEHAQKLSHARASSTTPGTSSTRTWSCQREVKLHVFGR